ncbi:hypothetical protein MD484_g8045, partial [Candolleomyces efflorescens]
MAPASPIDITSDRSWNLTSTSPYFCRCTTETQFTSPPVVGAQGLYPTARHEGTEGSTWKPKVTIRINKETPLDVVLDASGRNPNLKQFFRLEDVNITSKVEIQLWYGPPRKRKKKRNLVGCVTHTFGDLLNVAEENTIGEELIAGNSETIASSHPSSAIEENAKSMLRRRPSYKSLDDALQPVDDSEAPPSSEGPGDSAKTDTRVIDSHASSSSTSESTLDASRAIFPVDPHVKAESSGNHLAMSDAPEDKEWDNPEDDLRWWEVLLGNLTLYIRLRNAKDVSDFEDVLLQLRWEWAFVGGLLVAIGAVDMAIFAIPKDGPISIPPVSLSLVGFSLSFIGLGSVHAL